MPVLYVDKGQQGKKHNKQFGMRTGNEVVNAHMNLRSASGTAVVQQVPREPLADPCSVVSSVRISGFK